MAERFTSILQVGKINSLGRTAEVVRTVLKNPRRLPELYRCLFNENEWVRMRAGDALEKISREKPEWFKPYINRFLTTVAAIDQPSVQWHLAQMFGRLPLTPNQKAKAIQHLKNQISTTQVDWIVSNFCMEVLQGFVRQGDFKASQLKPLLKKQQRHHSKAVRKRAGKYLAQLSN